MRPKVGVIINSPTRDLAGLVLVAKALADAGVEVFIIPHNLALKEGMYLGLDLVLLNYIRKTNRTLARQFFAVGTTMAVLDQEGGVMPDVSWFESKLPDAATRQLIKVFFSWGHHLADSCIEKDIFEPHQICITGSPRMDLLVEPYQSLGVTTTNFSAKVERPLILINTRFSLGNPEFGTAEVQMYEMSKLSGRDISEIQKWQSIQQSALQETAKLANQLAVRFPAAHFVLRPHPFENLQTYEPLLCDLPNLQLTREGSIHEWLTRADAVIQRSCSTAIEAALAGIPAFSPRWIAIHQEIESAESVSVRCEDFHELARHIDSVISGGYIIPSFVRATLSEIIPKWFHEVDGRSHQRIADRLILEMNKLGKPDALKMRKLYYEFQTPSTSNFFLERLNWKIARFFNLPTTTFQEEKVFQKYGKLEGWKKSSKAFSASQVQSMLDQLSSANTYRATPATGTGLGRFVKFHSVRIVKNKRDQD